MHKQPENETVILTEKELLAALGAHYRAFVSSVKIEDKNVLVEFHGQAPRNVGTTISNF